MKFLPQVTRFLISSLAIANLAKASFDKTHEVGNDLDDWTTDTLVADPGPQLVHTRLGAPKSVNVSRKLEDEDSDDSEEDASDSSDDNDSMKDQILELMKEVMPGQVANIDQVMKQYEGKEESLLKRLETMKANADAANGQSGSSGQSGGSSQSTEEEDSSSSGDSADLKDQILELMKDVIPHEAANIDKWMGMYKGREESFLKSLQTMKEQRDAQKAAQQGGSGGGQSGGGQSAGGGQSGGGQSAGGGQPDGGQYAGGGQPGGGQYPGGQPGGYPAGGARKKPKPRPFTEQTPFQDCTMSQMGIIPDEFDEMGNCYPDLSMPLTLMDALMGGLTDLGGDDLTVDKIVDEAFQPIFELLRDLAPFGEDLTEAAIAVIQKGLDDVSSVTSDLADQAVSAVEDVVEDVKEETIGDTLEDMEGILEKGKNPQAPPGAPPGAATGAESNASGMGFDAQFCAGDFVGKRIFSPDAAMGEIMIPICTKLPLKTKNGEEWSIFAGDVNLPADVDAEVCGGQGKHRRMSFCLAVSTCHVLPSIAFIFDEETTKCLTARLEETVNGISSLLNSGEGTDTTVGFTLSNAFSMDSEVYANGEHFSHKASPELYTQTSSKIDSKMILPELDGWFTITGDLRQGINIVNPLGLPISEDIIDGTLDNLGKMEPEEILKVFSSVVVTYTMNGKFNLKVGFDKMPLIGHMLKPIDMQFEDASILISSGNSELTFENGDTTEIFPGFSTYIGLKGNGKAIRSLVTQILMSMDGIFDTMLANMPLGPLFESSVDLVSEIGTEFIMDKLEFMAVDSSKDYGFGVRADVESAGFKLKLPLRLGPGDVTDFDLDCSTDFEKFYCDPQIGDISAFFAALAEEIADGSLLILKKLAEDFVKGAEEAGKTIAMAVDRAAAKAGEVFGKENMEQTLKDVMEGKLDVGKELEEIASIGYAAMSALCKSEDCQPDGEACIGDPTGLKKKQGTCCSCCNDESNWWKTNLNLPGQACGLEPKWEDGSPCVIGVTCHMCKNGDNWWDSVPDLLGLPGQACGPKPCIPDGDMCVQLLSCPNCCSRTNMFAKCGKQGCLGGFTSTIHASLMYGS
ncbi:unknown protein [Seminavis robusta]|uniref:Uncharacterized protein n=1 Tax=Seminavis robusta TaxID=568900 RepID=A0A9N8DV34_9STRA|nr:unknown protein [Seminavis robusta]|eukprot:Sro304_g112630.1 n/a (1082) ;mRNA; f:54099-57917